VQVLTNHDDKSVTDNIKDVTNHNSLLVIYKRNTIGKTFFGRSERGSLTLILLGGNFKELEVWNFGLVICEGVIYK